MKTNKTWPSSVSSSAYIYIPAASRGYFDYKQSRVERAHSPVCELAAPHVQRSTKVVCLSFSRFLSLHIYAFYNAGRFAPAFVHIIYVVIFSPFVRAAERAPAERAGAKEIAQVDLHVTSVCVLLAFGLEIFSVFWRLQTELLYITSLMQFPGQRSLPDCCVF